MVVDTYKSIVEELKLNVTVFMVTHNRAQFLKDAINSVILQTFSDYVLFVIDNCSTDNTEEIVQGFQKLNSRILYLKRASEGLYDNALYAFNICTTKYIIILHDDDILKAGYLETLLNKLDINPEICAISPAAETIDSQSRVTGQYGGNGADIIYSDGSYFYNHFNKSGPSMIFPAVVYRKHFFDDITKFYVRDAGPVKDQLIWFEAEEHGGKLLFHNEVLFQYRNHEGQDSEKNRFFMDLGFLDYLLTNEKYKTKLVEIRNVIISYIYKNFLGITLKYYKDLIDESKYKTFFDYNCVGFFDKKCGIRGYYYSAKRYIIWNLRSILRLLYKAYKKVKG